MSHTEVKMHILVVDDNRDLADNVAELLTEEGHFAFAAHSGEEALVAAEALHFDVVLTDICMPGVNGVELITNLHERNPQATYLLMTAHASDEQLQAASSIGIDAPALPKPLVIEDLLSWIGKRSATCYC